MMYTSMKPLNFYRLSNRTGAVLENPVNGLPPYYDPWNRLARDMGELCRTNQLREFIKTMPVINVQPSLTYEELRFAHKIMTFAASTYVWSTGEDDAPDVLPAQISVPLLTASLELGIPPILTHQDLVLCNCAASVTENIPEVINLPTQHESWKHFIELSGMVEISFAPIFSLFSDIIDAQNPLNEANIVYSLGRIRQVLDKTGDSLSIFYERLDSNEFYVHLRPIMCGWNRKPIENGIVFEGVTKTYLDSKSTSFALEAVKIRACDDEENNWARMSCMGANAAQSICLQAIDTLLQIQHEPKNEEFFDAMRMYMIPEHRIFLQDLKKNSHLGEIVQETHSDELQSAFKACTEALRRFRDKHLELVVEFIEKPANQQAAKLKSLESTGTGGQALRNFLLSVRNSSSPVD